MTSAKDIALKKIAKASKGTERAALLKNDELRGLLLNSGANVTIYDGSAKPGTTCQEMLQDVYIGLIQRKNKKGYLDGLGALGGLAERTPEEQFAQMSNIEKLALLGEKDDIILRDGHITLTRDINIIHQNNVLREMREELADLGIHGITINPERLQLIPMPKVKDDSYMINIWDGKGECFAITPYCHLYKDEENLINRLSAAAQEYKGGEATTYKRVPLFEALAAYGHPAENGVALEDGRSASKDYRYPHEYLTAWVLAAELLQHNPEKMVALADEVQRTSDHQISFARLAKATGQSMNDLAEILHLNPGTLSKMEQACAKYNSGKQISVANEF
ncbi:MAG: hypothetical protein ILA52_02040 [Alphaproteobacteria bacterium]|nr:hypothetical protein [Alphaproteobacteria bacterium]